MRETSIRIRHLRKIMKERGLDSCFVVDSTNRLYLTGFESSEGFLLVTLKKIFLFLDGRYASMGRSFLKKVKIVSYDREGKKMSGLIKTLRLRTIGYDHMHLMFADIKKSIRRVSFHSLSSLLQAMRIIKTPTEIKHLREACVLTDAIFEELTENIHEGMTEWEIQKLLHGIALQHDQFAFSFSPIVAIGKHSSFPHYNRLDRKRKLKKGDLLLIDMGIDRERYKSDMTRMLFVGKPSRPIRRDYEKLRSIHEKIVQSIYPGQKISDTVSFYQQLMKKEGWTRFIKHGLGHGVGMQIHEGPVITKLSKQVWQSGMVVAVEPGMYKSGRYGMRVEDTVLVGKKRALLLTKTRASIEDCMVV